MSVGEQNSEQPSSLRWKKSLSLAAGSSAVTFNIAIFIFFVWACFSRYQEHAWGNMAAEHFPTIVGVPLAALAAFGLVVTLDVVAGHIEFKGLGLNSEAQQGPSLCGLSASLRLFSQFI